jgi:hypothetical protein
MPTIYYEMYKSFMGDEPIFLCLWREMEEAHWHQYQEFREMERYLI